MQTTKVSNQLIIDGTALAWQVLVGELAKPIVVCTANDHASGTMDQSISGIVHNRLAVCLKWLLGSVFLKCQILMLLEPFSPIVCRVSLAGLIALCQAKVHAELD